jgi:HEAT repeat protein
VGEGLATTLELLTATDNEAAVRVLISALDSPNPAIQEGALSAILHRRHPAGGQEILRRMPKMKPEWKAVVRQHHGRMTGALRDAILGSDPQMCCNACQAATWFQEYDLIPTLLTAIEDPGRSNSEMAAKTLLELVENLYKELAGTRDPSDRRDPQLIRRFVVGNLERSVQRFGQHKRREVVESFLLLVARDNVTLKLVIQNPHHAAFLPLIEALGKSPQGGVIRLLLSFLDDPHIPSGALTVIANRGDGKFVEHLLRKVGREPAATLAQNVKRIETIPWLRAGEPVLEQLDDAGQHAAVRLAMAAGIPRPQAFDVIEHLLLSGKPGGRREAARALAEFRGADANALAVRALDDPDPQVQANIVAQLRSRGIPGVLTDLLELVDSPYEVVRKAARENLTEFSFKRYLGAFDMLDEEVRRSTGLLVKKIDPQTLSQLAEEMESPVRTRRLRAVAVAQSMEVVGDLQQSIIILLGDEDHMVRVEAAVALAHASSPEARRALQAALHDSSETVRQTAERSLQEQESKTTTEAAFSPCQLTTPSC